MSTSLVGVNQTWQLLVSGPTAAFSISALTNRQYFQASPTEPNAADRGHTLSPGEGIVITLTGSDDLWVRTANVVNDQLAITT